jgi:hypothetical protein
MRGEAARRRARAGPRVLSAAGPHDRRRRNHRHLGPTLDEVARFHEKLLVVSIKRFSVLIEPVGHIVTGAIVGFVYIAFFMASFPWLQVR